MTNFYESHNWLTCFQAKNKANLTSIFLIKQNWDFGSKLLNPNDLYYAFELKIITAGVNKIRKWFSLSINYCFFPFAKIPNIAYWHAIVIIRDLCVTIYKFWCVTMNKLLILFYHIIEIASFCSYTFPVWNLVRRKSVCILLE